MNRLETQMGELLPAKYALADRLGRMAVPELAVEYVTGHTRSVTPRAKTERALGWRVMYVPFENNTGGSSLEPPTSWVRNEGLVLTQDGVMRHAVPTGRQHRNGLFRPRLPLYTADTVYPLEYPELNGQMTVAFVSHGRQVQVDVATVQNALVELGSRYGISL